MSKRFSALGVAVAAVVLLVGVVTPAVGSSGGGTKERTIRVDSIITEVNSVDVAPKGASVGDEVVFSNKLLDGAKQVGHEGSMCTTVSVVRNEWQCVATFSFPGGEITAQGLVLFGSMTPYSAPITGGSGKYQAVAGELRVTPVSPTEGIQTLYLKDL